MGARIVVTFVDEGVSGVVELLEDQAPKSCAAVLTALPQSGEAHHATYSGSEVVLILDRDLNIGHENATTKVLPGDFGYTRFNGGEMWGFPKSFSEICWFYDRDAVPSMPDGPVPMNIIGRFVEGFEEIQKVSRRMRREGVKRLEVRVE